MSPLKEFINEIHRRSLTISATLIDATDGTPLFRSEEGQAAATGNVDRATRLCAASVALWLDDVDGVPSPERIEAVESALARTDLPPAFTDLAIHAISHAWERADDLEAALVAIRHLTRARPHLKAPSLLREARLAARLGRIEEARRAYLAYLALRRDPEPGPAADAVAQARTELAALTPN
ncbi:MAG TPA: hypothetical protein VK837_05975 [Longimicrobiales bacterium]|nr:hypothetical protein [Longimicrobiales bacterium]